MPTTMLTKENATPHRIHQMHQSHNHLEEGPPIASHRGEGTVFPSSQSAGPHAVRSLATFSIADAMSDLQIIGAAVTTPAGLTDARSKSLQPQEEVTSHNAPGLYQR